MDEEIMNFQWFDNATWDSVKDLRDTTYVQPPLRFNFALQQAQNAILPRTFCSRCALFFAAPVCSRPQRSPCPMVNATALLLAPHDADAKDVFDVSCAMRKWRYAWRAV